MKYKNNSGNLIKAFLCVQRIFLAVSCVTVYIYHGVAQISLVSLLFNSLRENVARKVARYFPTAVV